MPNSLVKSFLAKTGKSVEDVESVWKETEEQVKKEYKGKLNYAIVTSIVKKKLGLHEDLEMYDVLKMLNENFVFSFAGIRPFVDKGLDVCYEQGRDAALDPALMSNPYAIGSLEYQFWDMGYRENLKGENSMVGESLKEKIQNKLNENKDKSLKRRVYSKYGKQVSLFYSGSTVKKVTGMDKMTQNLLPGKLIGNAIDDAEGLLIDAGYKLVKEY